MSVVKELLRAESDGSISFGDHSLDSKAKLEDFRHGDDLLKVKTFKEITRLEKNEIFLYESVPGTSVTGFKETEGGMSFSVEGPEDAQITVGLEPDTEYEVIVGDSDAGRMKTNLGGKLAMSVELAGIGEVKVEIRKI
ncbi:MAG: endosialidase [Lachnospiraceae bacterium]|nr:endosialidase [Lachnospiraceae bacterium]